jgi:predicted nucleic acid-binding protein
VGRPLSGELLIDSSAWARMWSPELSDGRADQLGEDLEHGMLAVCLPFMLEAGYSARDAAEHEELVSELGELPKFEIDSEIERSAFDAQSQLARAGHHRVSGTDLILAAIADRHEIGVLHYDKDFDFIREKTDLDFRSEWLMPRGSLS